MKTFSKRDNYFCALLEAPENLDIFANIRMACYVDKVANPSVDDDGAANVIRQAQSKGVSYWQSKFERDDTRSFVLFRREGNLAHPIGFATVVLPTTGGNIKVPLMCDAHILSDNRERGLSHLLIDACLKYISHYTHYNDVHVLAHKDNDASIAGLKKRGFYVLDAREKYIKFLGRIPMICPRKPTLNAAFG